MILLHHNGYSIAQCITFGQPKVTNKTGAKQIQDLPLLRIINERDIVPSLPPSTPLNVVEARYEHFAPEIIIHAGHHECNLQHQPMSSADSFWSHLLKISPQGDIRSLAANIEEHYLRNYLLNLSSNLKTPDLDLERILKNSA